MTKVSPDVIRGTELLTAHLNEIIETNPEIGDFHSAFEVYCMNKFSLGSTATTIRVGGKHDLGIDFFSGRDHGYNVGQCKIPAIDWLEANPGKIRDFGPGALSDARDALRYLFGSSQVTVNDRVRHLYGLIQTDKGQEDFSLTFHVLVFGVLNERGESAFEELRKEYEQKHIRIKLQQVDTLIDEFIVGTHTQGGEVSFELRTDERGMLRAKDYCYFLANAADLFAAFQKFGWRLFDLNLRYEVQNSAINGDIVGSLKLQKGRRQFHHYNNGLIVVAESYRIRDGNGSIRLHGAQIVNGLQTVKSIYNSVAEKEVELTVLERECVVQVKVIATSDPDFVSKVVQCTNNQNPMAARNIRSNAREQKKLKKEFAEFKPKWFLQTKDGEWKSLTEEGSRFFKQVIGYPAGDFKPIPTKKSGRVIDNQDAAKSWLAMCGFSDLAGDRVTHYFADQTVYELSFMKRPTAAHWQKLGSLADFNQDRQKTMEDVQGTAAQYLLAYSLMQFAKSFIPSPQKYREQALDEGVRTGRIEKSSGSFTSTPAVQDEFLATNTTYQTWRVMANMKELLVESAAQILTRKYGAIDDRVALRLLTSFDFQPFAESGELRELAIRAATSTDLPSQAVFSRIFAFLRYVSQQFWEEKGKSLLSQSRIRTLLLERSIAATFKSKLSEIGERKGLEKAWKPEGKTFLDSMPN